MTQPLKERLVAVESSGTGEVTTNWYRNPDGREALARIEVLEAEMRRLMRGYVGLLETGRDRIISFGGTCDAVDVMEEGDPYLRQARSALNEGTKP